MKPKIVNVIEIVNGVISSVDSFIIPEGKDKTIKKGVFKGSVIKAGSEEVARAEQLFTDKAMENGALKEDMNSYLDDGSYESKDGYEVVLVWSN